MSDKKVLKKSTLRNDILSMDDCSSQEVTIKEWKGVRILVKSFTAEERYNLLNFCMDSKNPERVDGGKLFIYTVIASSFDPDNLDEKIFSDGDYNVLKIKSASALEQIVNVSNRLNGLLEEDIKAAEKN